jgi:antitoxin (DNA-binding transcriptional repressor) of toxin-antitoxin stability system
MLPDDGRVVSNFIVQGFNGEALTLYGDGSQTRSFCFVDDLIEGMIRLMDEAHTGEETIVLAKAGRPWARLMPLEPTPAQRIPGRLSALGPLPHPESLLEPLSPEELASWESSSLPKLDHSHDGQHGLTTR